MTDNLPKDDSNKPDDQAPKKKSFRQKWNEWWKLTWESFVIEVQDRVLMSWKRIIKFCGIVLIPIIYGVICTVAFWNPIEKIGKSELIVMDNDISVLLVSDNNAEATDNKKGTYTFGTVSSINEQDVEDDNYKNYIRTILTGKPHEGIDINGKDLSVTKLKDDDIEFFDSNILVDPEAEEKTDDSTEQPTQLQTIGIKQSAEAINNDANRNQVTADILTNARIMKDNSDPSFQLTNGQSQDYKTDDAGFSFQIMSAWQLLKGALLPKTDLSKADKDYTFATPIVNKQENISLTNIKYSPDVDKNKKEWTKNYGYMQANIPHGYTANVINYLSLYLQKAANIRNGNEDANKLINDELKNIVKGMTPVKFWTTFERNFLFGYLFTALSGSLGSTAMAELPGVLNSGLISNGQNYISTDGARFLSMIGNDNEAKISPIDKNTNYVIAESTSFGTGSKIKAEELKSSALFGNVNTTDKKTVKNVGGKFINTLKNIVDTTSNAGFDDIGSLLLGKGWDQVKKVIDDIKKAIAGKDTPSDDSGDKKPQTLNLASAPSIDDAIYVDLNEKVYKLATGQANKDDYDFINGTLSKVWGILYKNDVVSEPYKDITVEDLFGKDANGKFNPYITLDQFNTNFNHFLDENNTLFFDAKNVNQVLPNIVNQFGSKQLLGLKMDDIFVYGIQGESAGIYGIGLGEFFLTIGLYVGCLLQTFIFDRAKRLNKSKWSNWYISKYMLMLGIMAFQVTAEMWVVYACGWDHYVTAAGMTYSWLWMLFNGFVFITIVQALWFIIKDESIGRFLCVLVLVFSLAAGGGTFPAYTQFGFFEAIGPLVPFTYTLRGLGEIAYGISQNNVFGASDNGLRTAQSLEVLKNFGILWIYVAIFLPLGLLVGAKFRMKEMDYGSHYGYAVAGAMKALGRDTSRFQILKKVTKSGKKKFYYDWKSLPDGFDPELYFQCRKMYKFEGEFKWWTRKHHDFVQKPNYSDEDTVTRNE